MIESSSKIKMKSKFFGHFIYRFNIKFTKYSVRHFFYDNGLKKFRVLIVVELNSYMESGKK